MTAGTLGRRLIAGAVGLAALAAGAMVTAAPAQAATITVPYVCTTNYLGVDFDNGNVPYNVTISAPPSVDFGDPIPTTYDFGQVPVGLPFPLTNVSVSNVGTVIGRLQTTGSPSVNASSAPSPTTVVGTVPVYGTVPSTPVTVSVPTTPFLIGNKVELVPSTFSMTLVTSDQFGPNGATTTCSPTSTTQFGARTTILGVPPVSPDDRCVAYNSDATGGPGCDTQQVVNLSITQGRLVQRVYTNATPASGPGVIDGSAITSPVVGTSTVNTNPTTVNLGTLTSPLAPTVINGTLNDITVTDNRGGLFGWSLSATMTDFTGTLGNTLAKGQLAASPSCSAATSANAWDYEAPGQSVIPGFDPASNAPGQSAGSPGQTFAGTVTLCTKNSAENVLTGSSGGVYSVTTPVALTMPAFQAADRYSAVLTVLLV